MTTMGGNSFGYRNGGGPVECLKQGRYFMRDRGILLKSNEQSRSGLEFSCCISI